MSEDRQDQDTQTTRRVPINLGLLHPIGTPQVTPLHALAPGAQSLGSLMIQPPRQDSLFPAESGQQYLSQGPIGSPTVPVSQSIDPALVDVPGTGAYAARQANLERAANTALSFGPGQFRAYHGTGATPFEQFLDEFIGTGEGAQAYSWGHYVAGSPGVARSYVPPGTEAQVLFGGQSMLHASGPGTALAYGALTDTAGTGSNWINDALSTLQSRRDAIPGLKMPSDQAASATKRFNDAIDWINTNRRNISHTEPSQGGLLNVWVKPDHEEFLDWHLPLDKQEPEVIDKLKKLSPNDYDPDITGEEFYDRLRDEHLSHRPFPFSSFDIDTAKMRASKELDEAGIPGMRFLDQQSRGMPDSMLSYRGDEPLPAGIKRSMDSNPGSSLDEIRDRYSYIRERSKMSDGSDSNVGGQYKDLMDFIDRNRNHFVMHDPRTYNYVVYDPKNIEITHRDGERVHTLEPVDHDPWAEQKAVP